MSRHEYRVLVAPDRPRKFRSVNGKDRFAHTLTAVMNEMAAEGWEFLRAERLPVEERRGLFGRTVTQQNLLVFRREAEAPAQPQPQSEVAETQTRPRREAPIPFNAAFRRSAPGRKTPPLTAIDDAQRDDRTRE